MGFLYRYFSIQEKEKGGRMQILLDTQQKGPSFKSQLGWRSFHPPSFVLIHHVSIHEEAESVIWNMHISAKEIN